jgi:hypothetical protein
MTGVPLFCFLVRLWTQDKPFLGQVEVPVRAGSGADFLPLQHVHHRHRLPLHSRELEH